MEIHKQSFLAIRLAAIIMIFCFIIFDVLPKVNLILKAQDKIRFNQQAVEQVSKDDKKAVLDKSQAELDKVSDGLKRMQTVETNLRSHIPVEVNIPALTLGLEDLAANLHVELRLIKPLPDDSVGDYQVQPIAIEFTCEYPVLVEFVRRLSDLSIPMSVGNMTINENNVLAPKLDVQLTLIAIYTKESKPNVTQKTVKPQI